MAKFPIGERTGRKADPSKVEKDMRAVRNPSNEYQFSCTEWLTTSQIQNFSSRLAASRRKGLVGISVEQQEDVECLVEDSERQELMQKITDEVGLKHPITYDSYDLCEFYHENKLSSFNVPMLKKILSHLEIQFKSKEKNASLMEKLGEISECRCHAPCMNTETNCFFTFPTGTLLGNESLV